jgi:uncharacterized RDD family membrane protein YckC
VLRRLAAMIYESLLLAALLLAGGFLFVPAATGRLEGAMLVAFQAWLLLVVGGYFVWSWHRGGQTLAMKAWRLRVVTRAGEPVGVGRALLRFVAAALTLGVAVGALVVLYRQRDAWLAWAALAPAAASFAMGFLDVQGRFLHDRVSGTKIVHEKALPAAR